MSDDTTRLTPADAEAVRDTMIVALAKQLADQGHVQVPGEVGFLSIEHAPHCCDGWDWHFVTASQEEFSQVTNIPLAQVASRAQEARGWPIFWRITIGGKTEHHGFTDLTIDRLFIREVPRA